MKQQAVLELGTSWTPSQLCKVKQTKFSFILWCAFDSANFKLLIFFDCLFFLPVFMNLFVKIYMERYDRHNKTHWKLFTNSLNSLIYLNLLFCSSKIKFHISYWTKAVTDSNLILLQRGENVKKEGRKKKTRLEIRSSNLSQAFRHLFSFV